ncbi:hypothetical protein TDB9533_04474 [Thalassocella blandensis]|nr:hypothetical protein TDB9533_04474 [Thalassocella blandensis]
MKKSFIIGTIATVGMVAFVGIKQYDGNQNQETSDLRISGYEQSHDNKNIDASRQKDSPSALQVSSNKNLQSELASQNTTVPSPRQNEANTTSKMRSSIETSIAELAIPEDLAGENLASLESMDQRISAFFKENEVIQQINDGLIDEDDKQHVSRLIRKATEVRSKAFDLRAVKLQQQFEDIKKDVAEGKIPMPQPLSQYEIQQIEDLAMQEYEELKRQERKRIRVQEELLKKEEAMLLN